MIHSIIYRTQIFKLIVFFFISRRNHQRTIESAEASLEAEVKAKNDALKHKSKLELELAEAQVALEHANRNCKDMQNNNKKIQLLVAEHQMQIQDEQRKAYELSEALAAAERRANSAASELEATRNLIEQADRGRKLAEANLQEVNESLNETSSTTAGLLSQKRKLEGELAALQTELGDCVAEMRSSEERAKKAINDAAKLADELRQEKVCKIVFLMI